MGFAVWRPIGPSRSRVGDAPRSPTDAVAGGTPGDRFSTPAVASSGLAYRVGLIRSLSTPGGCDSSQSCRSDRTSLDKPGSKQGKKVVVLASLVEHVIGIDPDRDRVTASVVDTATTGEQASAVFETSGLGYKQLLKWVDQYTQSADRVWSVEGTGSYGAGVTSYLVASGELVTEFNDPTPSGDGAKTDALDARRAARQALGRSRPSVPRVRGDREALRVLETTRRGAITARTSAINELKALLVTAPVDLRDQLRGVTTAALVAKCHRFRLRSAPANEHTATKQAMRSLVRRINALTIEAAQLKTTITELVQTVAPQLLQQPGIGPITAAQVFIAWSHPRRCRNEAAFARLAGVAPLEASSGQHTRHRLNRRGDRHLYHSY